MQRVKLSPWIFEIASLLTVEPLKRRMFRQGIFPEWCAAIKVNRLMLKMPTTFEDQQLT
jgi:hypothetical protein